MLAWQVLFMSIAGAALSGAQENNDNTPDAGIINSSFIVEFIGKESLDDFYQHLRSEDNLAVTHRLDLSFKLFQGASFTVDDVNNARDIEEKIIANPRVKNVWPVRRVAGTDPKISSTGQSNIAMAPSSRVGSSKRAIGDIQYDIHTMTQIDRLHAAGFTGKGVKIGIIDSGIDYTHPDLGGCLGPGCKVSYGHDLIGSGTIDAPKPDADPIDTCMGHGTHVAGIIASRPSHLGFLGAAPDAELGAFRALDCLGGSSTDLLIAAFNMAYEAGSDIISASVGFDGGWPDDAWSLAAQRIVDAGVPVVAAAGNDGDFGIFRSSNPAAGRGVTSVGSVDGPTKPFLMLAGSYTTKSSEEAADFGWIAGTPGLQNATLPLIYLQSVPGDFDACGALPDNFPDLSTYMVLAEESTCHVETQTQNLAAKGARQVIFFGTSETPLSISLWNPVVDGVARVTATQGRTWVTGLMAGNNITVSIIDSAMSDQLVVRRPNTSSAGHMSWYTSWGPDWELNVYPKASAPGDEILSTFPVARGSYAVESGTSMACPLVAGAMALIGQARGSFDPKMLHSAIASTAKHLVYHDGTSADSLGRLTPVPQGGPGLLQAWDAAQAKFLITSPTISFNDTDHTRSATISIQNLNEADAIISLSSTPALTVYSFAQGSKRISAFPPLVAEKGHAQIDFSGASVQNGEMTIKAGATALLTVACTPPGDVDAARLPVYSGFLQLNSSRGGPLSIPYLGVAGSMLNDTRFFYTADPAGVYLADSKERWPVPIKPDTVFRVPKLPPGKYDSTYSWPQARVVINTGSKHVRVDVVPKSLNTTLSTTEWLGYQTIGQVEAFPLVRVTRSSFRATFTGRLAGGQIAPAGRYFFVLSALRLFGNETKEEDWDKVVLDSFYFEYI
ncbi:minor extracellular serine protease Vpr [Microdochium nivale]|nr:minor extracellular serine protease Vpr [Microdochium nivale]